MLRFSVFSSARSFVGDTFVSYSTNKIISNNLGVRFFVFCFRGLLYVADASDVSIRIGRNFERVGFTFWIGGADSLAFCGSSPPRYDNLNPRK